MLLVGEEVLSQVIVDAHGLDQLSRLVTPNENGVAHMFITGDVSHGRTHGRVFVRRQGDLSEFLQSAIFVGSIEVALNGSDFVWNTIVTFATATYCQKRLAVDKAESVYGETDVDFRGILA